MRVATSWAPTTSPWMMAMWSFWSRLFQNAAMRKSPKRLGSLATATMRTHTWSGPKPLHSCSRSRSTRSRSLESMLMKAPA